MKEKVEKFIEYIKQNPEKTQEDTRKKLYEYIFLEEKQKKNKSKPSLINFVTKSLYERKENNSSSGKKIGVFDEWSFFFAGEICEDYVSSIKIIYLKEEIDYYVEHYRFMGEIRFFVKIK